MKQMKLEKVFYRDYCEWEASIKATISPDLQDQINTAKKLIEEHDFIESLNIHPPGDFLDEETIKKLTEQCLYEAEVLLVYSHDLYFRIQGKYDSSIQAEYLVVEEEQEA